MGHRPPRTSPYTRGMPARCTRAVYLTALLAGLACDALPGKPAQPAAQPTVNAPPATPPATPPVVTPPTTPPTTPVATPPTTPVTPTTRLAEGLDPPLARRYLAG